jgi:CheY-like chemotaxis protein
MDAHLLGLSGYKVAEGQGGASAVVQLSDHLPSVVVTDVRMPGSVSAVELCRRYRDLHVPVIVLTGVAPGREHQEAQAARCASVRLKPVTPDQLVAEVQRVHSTKKPLHSNLSADGCAVGHICPFVSGLRWLRRECHGYPLAAAERQIVAQRGV